jgi:cell division protein ZapA
MRKTVQAVSLSILGKDYKIACEDGEQDALLRSAHELDRQMRMIRDTGKVGGADRIAVLAALNMTHDHSAQQSVGGDAELCERIGSLRRKIENALDNY